MALLEIEHLKKYFPSPRGTVHAVDDVTFSINKGETMGLVGESGCGKSTLGRTIIHLQESTDGVIRFEGNDVTHLKKDGLKKLREDMQIIFQDPYSSLNPRLTLHDTVMEPLKLSGRFTGESLEAETRRLMDLTYLFVTHDLSVVRHISTNICVMYLGQMVETGPTQELFENPLHPYTQALLSAIPTVDIHNQNSRILLKGEINSPINPKPGCRFAKRCPYVTEKCSQPVELQEITPGHFCSCSRLKEIGR